MEKPQSESEKHSLSYKRTVFHVTDTLFGQKTDYIVAHFDIDDITKE